MNVDCDFSSPMLSNSIDSIGTFSIEIFSILTNIVVIVNEKIPDIDILELPIPIHRQQRVLHRSYDNRDRVEFYLDLALSCIMNEYPASKRFCKKNLAQLFHELNIHNRVHNLLWNFFIHEKISPCCWMSNIK